MILWIGRCSGLGGATLCNGSAGTVDRGGIGTGRASGSGDCGAVPRSAACCIGEGIIDAGRW
jgi:hypothetical protein